jgi:hypothetical protein
VIGGNLTVTGALAAALDMGDVILSNVETLRNDAAIKLQPSGDTDDYLSLTTESGVPKINIIGGNQYHMTSDDADYIVNIWWDDATHYFYLGYNKSSHYGIIRCTDAMRMWASNDTNDYLYFATAANIAGLYPQEDKVHVLGSASLSYDHVYADDFDNTSPFEIIPEPLEKLKAIASKKVMDPKQGEIDALDYTSLPDFVRTHVRDPTKDVVEEFNDPVMGDTQQRVIERAPKDVIADEGFSINRMCILLYQAVQELTAKVETLEAQIAQGAPKA